MNTHLLVQLLGVLICVNLFELSEARTSDELRITLPNGSKLVGRTFRSHDGRPIKAFLSVPYAKPPLGPLRFKAPEPMEKWDGEYHAVKDGPICVQRDPFRRDQEIEGSEDCLQLNVYAPHSFESKKTDLPVMVFFHGGGFQCGSGIRPFYGPDFLLDHDVVYVGVNFRLGPLGFLSTEQEDCPGNFGLKDQVLALKWIQENIKEFGGDPKSVTVFGESAGGASATYLMMSPLAKGLFSKAIAQSGTNLAAWSQPAHKGVAKERATKLAEMFKCYTPNNWPKSLNCLRNVPAENITAAFYDFFMWDTDPMIPFPPVVEPDIPGAYITKHPRGEHDENALNIPLLTGLTYDEGAMKSAPIFSLPGLFEDFANNLEIALPIALNYDHHDSSVQQLITEKINQFYFGNTLDRSKDKQKNVTNLFTDGWFLEAMDQYLELRLSHKNIAPTYVYLFTHKGAASFTEIFKGGRENYWGVSHAEELQYLFPIADGLFISALPTKEDQEIRKGITQLWVDFARTGNPTPSSSYLPKWEKADGFPLKYYRIGNSNHPGKPLFGMEVDGIFHDRATFWREIGAHLPSGSLIGKDEL